LCKELEPEKTVPRDNIIGDTGKIAEVVTKPITKPPVVDVEEQDTVEPETVATEAAESEKVEPEPAKVIGKSPSNRAPAPKPSLPASHNKKMDQNLVSFFNSHVV